MEIGIGRDVDLPYEVALARVEDALKKEGFGILTRIDVKATMKEKLGVDFTPFVILGACNPPLAHRALESELEIGLLLPCNVIVYETTPDHAVVAAFAPVGAMGVVGNTELLPVAQEAETRLRRALAALEQG